MNNYDDIINLPHHESSVYKRMPVINRATQFAPFAALTGYEEAIEETGRITNMKSELDEYIKEDISNKINYLADKENGDKKIIITYFVPDLRKEGGEYVTKSGFVLKVDEVRKELYLDDNTVIKISDITAIDGLEIYY